MGVNAFSVLNQAIHSKIRNARPPSSSSSTSSSPKTLTPEILNHLNSGNLRKAVQALFSSPFPFSVSLYAHLFNHCSSPDDIVEARKLECHLTTFNPTPPTFILNRAIEAFGKCRCLRDAKGLFDQMPQPNGGSWNAIITGFSQGGYPRKALRMFVEMRRAGFSASEVTFAGVLSSCGVVLGRSMCMQVHGMIVKQGFCGNVILGSSLVDVYGKCRVMCDARRVFDEMELRNSVSWNVMVRRYFEIGEGKEAVIMFFRMLQANIWPLNFTFSNALIACSSFSGLLEGKQIHGVVVTLCLELDEVVSNSLINMYVKCAEMEDAQKLFDQLSTKDLFRYTSMLSGYALSGRTGKGRELFDEMPDRNVVSWNAMLSGYVHALQWEEALNFFSLMRSKTKDIDHVTLGLFANVCAGLSNLELGKQLHGFVYRNGFVSNLLVGNSILDMYGKCGNLHSARIWFHQMSQWRDSVSWNSLLTSFARQGRSEQAIEIFRNMHKETTPSEFTLTTLLAACANTFALEHGKQIHGFMVRNWYRIDVVVSGALVDMYSKCRYISYAIKVFRGSPSRDVVLWNSLILGCFHNRRGEEVLKLFQLMQQEGVKPDYITFHGALLACASLGLVDVGKQIFDSLINTYSIIPRLEHYECMVELYSHNNCIDDLKKLISLMPFDPTKSMLTKISEACEEYGHLNLGKWASELLMQLDNVVPYETEVAGRT